MKKILLATMITISSYATSLIQAEEESLVKSVLPKTKIVKVTHSQIDGLYKAYLGNGNIIYVYPYKRIIFFGELYTNTGLNLTARDKEKWSNEVVKNQLKNLNVKELIKDSFELKFGKGSKRYAFVIFTDPECPFCRKVDKFLQDKKVNATFYVNYMPLYFHKNAKKWALQILSSKDKKSAIEQIEKTNKDINITITQQAKDKLKNTQNLAKKLGIRGTPTLFVIDLKDKKVVDIIKGANIPKIQNWITKDKNEK